jgi:predicted DNA-binding transcriptional regulator AlpA
MGERVRHPVPDEVWTAEQVAEYFKVTERTLRDWRDRDATFPQPLDLPGRALRWYVDDVVAWTLSLRGGLTG